MTHRGLIISCGYTWESKSNIFLIDGGINNKQVRLQVRLFTFYRGLLIMINYIIQGVISAGGQSIAERQTAGGPNSMLIGY